MTESATVPAWNSKTVRSMTNDRKDEAPAGSAEEWPKREGPTIDLDASDVSGDTRASGGTNTFFQRMTGGSSGTGSRVLSKLVAPVAGAVAAVLVLGAFWAGGLIGKPEPVAPAVSPTQFDNVAANVGDLTARVARVEAAAKSAPAAPAVDPTLAGRTESLEKSLSAVREEIGKLNGQLRTITASLNELKAMPRDGAVAAVPVPDLGPLNERLTQLEEATRALASDRKGAADDINVRRLVVANTLDMTVRRGEPFAAALTAAKQIAADANSLGPLDAFAARGIPPEATYMRDIVAVLQRIADGNAAKAKPADAEKSPAGSGILDRLQSGVTKLVRIERDGGPAAASSTPAGVPAVRREDLAAARKDVAGLPQAADPQIQAWLKSVDAREAAIAAAQKFSAEALAAFGKSGQ
jgi:hypothetical protein